MPNESKRHVRKLIAPLLITVLLLAFLGFYLLMGATMPLPFWARLILCALVLFLAGVAVYVLVERIKEIRSGEEDDLSQY